MEPKLDVFISHASEDKESFVRELAASLKSKGLNVWYDELSLTLGDNLRTSIEKGLKESRFGVVVLSPAFFQKQWTQRELDILVSIEEDRGECILPIWHNVTRSDVVASSPLLANRLAISSDEGISRVTEEILRAVGSIPDNHLTTSSDEEIDDSIIFYKETNSTYKSIIRHQTLSKILVVVGFLMVLVGSNINSFQIKLFALLMSLMGLFLFFGSRFIEKAINAEATILAEIERIGGFIFPFDYRFRQQWILGKRSFLYRIGLIFEAIVSVLVWIVLFMVWPAAFSLIGSI